MSRWTRLRAVGGIASRPTTWIAACAIVGALFWLRLGPLPPGLLDDLDRPSTLIVDRFGEPIFEARSAAGTRGERLRPGEVPPLLAAATIAAEDARFRSHPGVDPIAVVRAIVRNMGAGRVVEGGSTITQQVAKLLLARRADGRVARGWAAKAREAVVAIRLEHRLGKDEILALYLNLAPYGNQIEGAARASAAYFNRDVASLTPAETAFLAALPQQPSRFNPWKDPVGARGRQRRILDTMADAGTLTPAAAAVARAERLRLADPAVFRLAPHFVERVLSSFDGVRPRRIDTTLDATLQRTVQGIIAANRGGLVQHRAHNVAVAVLDNHTGEWLAWEGSGDYFDAAHGGTIDGVVTPRQPGSALKPFTYAAAFERGVTPARMLADVPSQFPTAEPGVLYSPRNYDGQFRGPLLARAALAGSENVPAVALASEVGVPSLVRLLRAAGFSTLDRAPSHYGLGLTIGNAEVRLDELIAAYAMLARGGLTVTPTWLRAGRPFPAAPSRVVSYRTAFWVTDILADNDAREYIFGRGSSLEFAFAVAAKSGTSQAYRDNWAVGYARDVTVGVWVGNFDRTPMRTSSGVTGAGPIFHDVMLAAIERVRGSLPIGDRAPILDPPADLHRVDLCALSGLTPSGACPTHVMERLPADAMPAACDWHRAEPSGIRLAWPAPFRAWAQSADRARAALTLAVARSMALPPATEAAPVTASQAASPARPATGGVAPLAIVTPLGGAVYLFDPTLRPAFQTLALRASGGADGPRRWTIDGVLVGHAGEHDTLRWPIARGTHTIRVEDAAGQVASTVINVR